LLRTEVYSRLADLVETKLMGGSFKRHSTRYSPIGAQQMTCSSTSHCVMGWFGRTAPLLWI